MTIDTFSMSNAYFGCLNVDSIVMVSIFWSHIHSSTLKKNKQKGWSKDYLPDNEGCKYILVSAPQIYPNNVQQVKIVAHVFSGFVIKSLTIWWARLYHKCIHSKCSLTFVLSQKVLLSYCHLKFAESLCRPLISSSLDYAHRLMSCINNCSNCCK